MIDNKLILNSPTKLSYKCWPGNLISADVVMVLSKLYIDNVFEGIFWFRVELGNENAGKGYVIKDIGEKMGYNGVENAIISFHNLEIPIDSLLAKYASFEMKDKNYILKCSLDLNKRFGVCLSGFPMERFGIASYSIGAAIQSTKIALEYSKHRLQFSISKDQKIETPIIEYNLQQRHLCNEVSKIVALKLILSRHIAYDVKKDFSSDAHYHSYTCCIKYLATEMSWEASHMSRFLTGGNGVAIMGKGCQFVADLDITRTFGGSNTLMLLECTKNFIYEVKKWRTISKVIGPLFGFSIKSLDTNDKLGIISKILTLFEYKKNVESWGFAKELMNLNRDEKILYYSNNGYNLQEFGKTCCTFTLIKECQYMLLNFEIGETLNSIAYYSLMKLNQSIGWFVINDVVSKSLAKQIPMHMNHICNEMINNNDIGSALGANENLANTSILCHKNYEEIFYEKSIKVSNVVKTITRKYSDEA